MQLLFVAYIKGTMRIFCRIVIILVVFLKCFYNFIFLPRLNYSVPFKYRPPEDEVTFFAYYSRNFTDFDRLFIGNNISVEKSKMNIKHPITLIIHGWTHGKDVPWVIEMREAMASQHRWNIIVVDWSALSHAMYSEARIHTSVVGKQVANFCLFLNRTFGYNMSTFHLIGHSMGAQIAAMAAHQIQMKSNGGLKVGRITGLDPASPLYEWPHIESLDDILDPNDAHFVDVIHTNGEHLGIIFPSGHLDFYPNGGLVQPDCSTWFCSHIKACEFWTASIENPHLFKAYPIAKWQQYKSDNKKMLFSIPMGILADKKYPHGAYFLETHNEEGIYLNMTTTLFDSFYI